jgi:hypothetical protein
MSSATASSPKPIVNSVYVLVSQEVSSARKQILSVIEQNLPKLAVSGKVERVDGFEPAAVRTLIGEVQGLVDVDPKNLPEENLRPLVRPLHLRHVSNGLKHQEALKRIASTSSGTERFSLILEDDVLFGEGMALALAKAAATAPQDAEVVFLGLPSTRQEPPKSGEMAFDDPMEIFKNHVLPSCDSYLITAAGAAKLAEGFAPLRFSAAGQLTYLLRKGIVKSYLSVPNAFVDGSKVGVVTSSLETNNQLLWNNAFCQMDAIVRRTPGEYTEEAKSKFKAQWETNPFKENPDALVLLADHQVREGNVKEAQETYAKAMAAYEKDGCIVNQGSEWIRKYMGTFSLAPAP